MKKKPIIIAAGIIIAVATVLLLRPGQKPTGERITSISIGYRPISPSLDFFVALEKGYFQEEGLEVDLHSFRGSSDLTDAIMNGKVNFASQLGMVTQLLPQLRSNKAMVRFIGFTADATESAMRGPVLIAKKGSGIQSITDLKGKTIGIFPGANFKIFIEAALRSEGLKLEDVTLMPIAPQEQIAAFLSVDALLSLDPITSGLQYKQGAVVIADRLAARYISDNFLTSATSVHAAFAEAHPEAVKRVEAALNRAIEFIRESPDQTADILAKHTGLPPQVTATMQPVKYITRQELAIDDLKTVCAYLPTVEWLNMEPSTLGPARLVFEK